MPELQEVFRMATQKVRPDPGFVDRQYDHRRRQERKRKIGAFAVVTAIVAAAGLAILLAGGDRSAREPADEPSVNTVNTRAERVATGFVEAFGAFDGEQAITYLADNPVLEMDATTPEGVPLFTSFLEAMGYKQILLDPCRATNSSAAGTAVRCAFDWHAIRSDEIGLGPYPGSWDLTVRNGEIASAALHLAFEDEFSPQMWEPFAEWVSTTYPKDFDVMYVDGGTNFSLTVESARLWEEHSLEYATMVNAENVIAEHFMEARNAYDIRRALSLVGPSGATIQLMGDNAMDATMRGIEVHMDRAELAHALEAERLFGMRYDSVQCLPDASLREWSPAQIRCTVDMDSRLRRIEGFAPATTSIGIGFRNGYVTALSFPWLSASFPGNVPTENWNFFGWVSREHPEAGGPMRDGALFETHGQELTLVPTTPESIQLLAQYLDEYERDALRGALKGGE